jgi:DNA-binding transcriptional LysR family regulator
MFIRQIHYLLALTKTEHFGRTAEVSHVLQPALSTAIQHLEEELGITIIKRGHHFRGLGRCPTVNATYCWHVIQTLA